MTRLVAGLLAVLLVVAGCARGTGGSPVTGPRDADPAAFFAGEVPDHGRSLTEQQSATQAYLRAVRRVDPCGFATREAMAGVGDVLTAGTMFEFNSCELEVKVAGDADPKIVSVAVAMTDIGDAAPVFTVGERPVYPYFDAGCGLQVPLPLSALPGAPVLTTSQQPYLQLAELVSQQGCEFVDAMTKAIVAALDPLRIPLRDAVAVYPVRAAERDPCEVLDRLDRVASWNPDVDQPFLCDFALRRDDSDVALRLEMSPRSPKDSERDFLLEERDGVDVYVGAQYCAAIAFVGRELVRTSSGGASMDMGEWATSPAVTASADAPHCDAATDVAVAAAKTFG